MPAFFASEGMPFWNELRTYDLDRSSDFYRGLFGWEIDSADNSADSSSHSSGYYYARKQGMPIAGIISVAPDVGNTAQHQSNQWMLSFLTDDVRAVADRSRDHGGTAGKPVDGPRGPMVAATDIVGAQLGFIHPASEPFIAGGEPGTPVWHELAAILPDGVGIDDVATYYTQVARWNTMRHGEGAHTVITAVSEGGAYAGVWFPGEQGAVELNASESRWTTYFGVDNIVDAAEYAQVHGGDIIVQPQNTEFGQIAILADPTGAPLTVCEAPEHVEEPHEGDNIFG